MSLHKYYRFGKNRGVVGNSALKRQQKTKSKSKPLSLKRHRNKGLKSSLVSECLVDLITTDAEIDAIVNSFIPAGLSKEEVREHFKANPKLKTKIRKAVNDLLQFTVSFRNKPLIGKVFKGEYLKHLTPVQREVAGKFLEKASSTMAAYEHAMRESKSESHNEEQKEAYADQAKQLLKKIKRWALTKMSKFTGVKLSITERLERQQINYFKAKTKTVWLRVTEIVEKDKNGYVCLCEIAYP